MTKDIGLIRFDFEKGFRVKLIAGYRYVRTCGQKWDAPHGVAQNP